jgi:hypothetical protein
METGHFSLLCPCWDEADFLIPQNRYLLLYPLATCSKVVGILWAVAFIWTFRAFLHEMTWDLLLLLLLLLLFIPLSLRTEHRASTVPRHPRLLFQFLGSIRYFGRTPWVGDQSSAMPLPTQDNTTQKDADKHPCPKQYSNLRSQCSSGRRQVLSSAA